MTRGEYAELAGVCGGAAYPRPLLEQLASMLCRRKVTYEEVETAGRAIRGPQPPEPRPSQVAIDWWTTELGR